MLADIVGKPIGLSWTEKCLTWEAYIHVVFIVNMLQFKYPAANSDRIPAGKAWVFPPVSRCHVQLQKTKKVDVVPQC
jgi:hypothetical protein